MTIYLDIILVENIIMNYVILLATGIIAKTQNKLIRIIFSSIIGAIYAVFSYCVKFSFFSTIIMKILLSILMIFIAFGTKKIKILAKQLMIFYLTSFCFGGASLVALSNLNPEKIKSINGVFIINTNFKLIFLGAVLALLTIIMVFRNMKLNLNKKNMICTVELTIDEKKKILNILIDSGNLLKDPITQKDIIIVQKNKLKDMLPESILNYTFCLLGKTEYTVQNEFEKHTVRIIPFSSLGNPNGMMLTIKPNCVKVYYDSYERILQDIYIGIYDQKLDINKQYEGLIGINLLEKKGSC